MEQSPIEPGGNDRLNCDITGDLADMTLYYYFYNTCIVNVSDVILYYYFYNMCIFNVSDMILQYKSRLSS